MKYILEPAPFREVVGSAKLFPVQVHISDVHIRYEDDFSCPARPFAFGFSMESLTAQVPSGHSS